MSSFSGQCERLSRRLVIIKSCGDTMQNSHDCPETHDCPHDCPGETRDCPGETHETHDCLVLRNS
jgi:hypothetical protein